MKQKMSKRTYLIIVFLVGVAAFFCAGPVFKALKGIVVPGCTTVSVFGPAGGVLIYFRFSLPFVLACAAIPIAFMIIRNHWRATVLLVVSLVCSGIAVFVIRLRVHASAILPTYKGGGPIIGLQQLHLEIVPWVLLGVMLLGTIVLRLIQRGSGSGANTKANPSQAADGPTGNAEG